MNNKKIRDRHRETERLRDWESRCKANGVRNYQQVILSKEYTGILCTCFIFFNYSVSLKLLSNKKMKTLLYLQLTKKQI